MTNLRTLTAPAATLPADRPAHRHRLRAVAPDELPPVAELLHPGARWLPAPQETLPTLPGQPPMIGYLVLVPAGAPQPAGTAPAAAPATGAGTSATATATAATATTSATATTRRQGDGLVSIDTEQRTVSVAGRPLDLTYLEFELLAHLVAHPHRVHSRDQLVHTVWGYGHVGDGRTVDVHVARLRRKMGPEYRSSIVTVRRVGYKYAPPAGI
ncbi:winged helix-turn-helix domain-containing protein [Streptomyces sp. NPDC049577]|uniref:winged helix-turn-helix domain-containing protein n=1 Tax=Streptomyces sp. NPDC049577 TaxID=3155153 RepID=UPI003422852F